MEDVEAWARMLGLLELHTDDIAGERSAVHDYADAHIASQED